MERIGFLVHAALGVITLLVILGTANLFVGQTLAYRYPNSSVLTYLGMFALCGIVPLSVVTWAVHRFLRWRGFTFAVVIGFVGLACTVGIIVFAIYWYQ